MARSRIQSRQENVLSWLGNSLVLAQSQAAVMRFGSLTARHSANKGNALSICSRPFDSRLLLFWRRVDRLERLHLLLTSFVTVLLYSRDWMECCFDQGLSQFSNAFKIAEKRANSAGQGATIGWCKALIKNCVSVSASHLLGNRPPSVYPFFVERNRNPDFVNELCSVVVCVQASSTL